MMLSDFVQLMECPPGMDTIVSFIKNGVFPIIQVGIPIILIVMGSIDLGKAVLSSDEKEIKASQGRLIKRCIAAVAVFFVVTIVSLLTNMVADRGIDSGATDWRACWNPDKKGNDTED